MKLNKILLVLCVGMAIALLIQSSYLLGMKHNNENSKLTGNKFDPKAVLARKNSQVIDDSVILNPLLEMQKMRRSMNRMFNDTFSRFEDMYGTNGASKSDVVFEPDVDVKENDNSYLVVVDVPGVDKNSIHIDAKPNSVTISGEREIENEVKDEAQGIYKLERSFGSFSRTIPLVQTIDPNKVEANSAEGVLMVKLPKVNPEKEALEDGVKVLVTDKQVKQS
ncbi:heat shock protein Hsp20 [Candidatus Omnitrophus magneticus]|uniref:Heat shock protein Hsp20 n=1 Tax=Candidatus Omnitrophus magneticus TaxID=1609969 RepID=A0A0F0CMN7_9BACT|nr:heat shock protein Hsp20 [Candidatus Omnitrophus magneticus]